MTGCLKSEHWVLEMEFRAFSDDTYYLYLLVLYVTVAQKVLVQQA
jgi:hypothetical protein